ncbi:MAG: transposase [Rhizobium sp.]|nr:transposase [Rhizobium sp.]
MSQTPNTAIAVIGIDIGKKSFHIVVQRCARRHRAAAKVVAWPSRSAARQYTACLIGKDASAKYLRPYSKGQKSDPMMPKQLPKPCSAPAWHSWAGDRDTPPRSGASDVLYLSGY